MCRIKAATRFVRCASFKTRLITLALSDSLKEVCRSFPSSIQARTVTKPASKSAQPVWILMVEDAQS